jgi:hypothetical protein
MKNRNINFSSYRPPRLWGRNGHLQTIFYGVLGHASLKRTYDRRYRIKLSDGTTVIYDVFERRQQHKTGSMSRFTIYDNTSV